MGGNGFFGLRLGDEWLVIAIWDSSSWIHLDGKLLEDHETHEQVLPDLHVTHEGEALNAKTIGAKITDFVITRTSLCITLDNGTCLSIEADPNSRPVYPGTGAPRCFLEDDDLRKAVFLSPTGEIWA